ncbi:MAG: preprotein translocase subunit SecE [Gemmatimonadales bacterium]|nr:MAG: preprotein translocase subunit SecE [Gemmatimonadales bacterium]
MVDAIKRTGEFLEECYIELQRVTWPDWPQLKNATLVVIVFCLMVSLVIWLMDMASRFGIDVIMGLFGV